MIFWVNYDFDRQDAYDREGKAQEQENQNDEKHENGKNRFFFSSFVESSLLNEPSEEVIASEDSNANENVKPDATSENICNICAKSFARAGTFKHHENNVHASKSTETASPYRRPVTRKTATDLKVSSPQQKSHVQSTKVKTVQRVSMPRQKRRKPQHIPLPGPYGIGYQRG
jgi:hypothetical protein